MAIYTPCKTSCVYAFFWHEAYKCQCIYMSMNMNAFAHAHHFNYSLFVFSVIFIYIYIYIYISSLILPTGELEKCYGIQGLTGTSPRFGSSTGQKTSTASQDAGSTLVGQVLLLDTHTVDGNAAPTGMYKPCK